MKLFESEQINDAIIRIKMPYVCAYIVKGRDRAVLIDTGFGYGDLKQFVDNLLDMPYDVICTHGHPDHAGGSMQFDQVYLPEGEFQLVKYGTQTEVRHMIMNRVMRKQDLSFPVEHFIPQKEMNYISYKEYDVFNLGGITIVPIHLPGHTSGIMGLLIPELKTAILGDACANPTIMNQESSATVESFREGLIKLKQHHSEFNTVLTQHSNFVEPPFVVDHNLYWAEQILLNKDDRFRIRLGGAESFVARNKNTFHQQGYLGNIIYRLDNIWNK